jgi:anti-repressor protein
MRLNQLQVFENSKFGQVRIIEKDGKPYFVGSDVAKALGYAIPHKAVQTHCKGVLKWNIPTNGGNQEMLIIPEGDVYRLIVRSQLPDAEKFERWVFDEVLPAIRQTGGYVSNDDLFIQTYLPYADEGTKEMFKQTLVIIRKQNEQIEQMKPKAEFFDAVASSKTAIPMDRVAKALGIKGLGRNKLFAALREKKILDNGNIPYQEFVDRGYFRVIEQKYTLPNGETRINIKTLVYQKGVDYIRKIIA